MDYKLTFLDPDSAPLMAALHAAIIDQLHGDEKSFILPKDETYFRQHLNKGGGNAVIGIFDGPNLIAQAMIVQPNAQYPQTGMVDMAPVAPPQSVSILQAVSVLPAYRQHGLMGKMIDAWQAHAQEQGRAILLAEIDVHNAASWIGFLKAGLNLVSIGRDPADGTLVYNACEKTGDALRKKLTPEFNRHAGAPTRLCAFDNLEKQERLMKRGYAAIGRDRNKQNLVMKKLPVLGP